MLTFGSAFAGIGGIDLGLERAGMKCKWQIEIDDYATRILEKHWSDVRRYRDIREVRKLEYVDVIAGGFPCQDISNAGGRAGITGERSGLWKEYLRVIRMVRPRYVVVENVAALINRGLDTVLADMVSCGYDAEWDCIPAAAIGAPHRRDRVFIMAYYIGSESKAMANSNRTWEPQPERIEFNKRERTCNSSQDMADSIQQGSQRNLKKESDGREQKTKPGRRSDIIPDTYNYNYWKQCQKSIQEANRKRYWSTDSGILRVAHGIPDRMDRIKCLGNAVVPQVAEFIGKRIIDLEQSSRVVHWLQQRKRLQEVEFIFAQT